MDIYSPDDCFIVKVFPLNRKVKAGDKLIQLYCPILEQKISRVQYFILLQNIKLRQYSQTRSQLAKAAKVNDLNQDNNAETNSIDVYNIELENYELGLTDNVHLESDFKSASDDEITQNADQLIVNQFDDKNQDAIDNINAILDAAAYSNKILSDIKNRMLISSPIDGVFNVECMEGLFYKKGKLIATLFS